MAHSDLLMAQRGRRPIWKGIAVFGLKTKPLKFVLSVCLGVCVLASLGEANAAGKKTFLSELNQYLDEPKVRLVVLEIYSDYCEPCMKAVPEWERLRDKYAKDGLRLVVINIDDMDNPSMCKRLPWRPWKLLCKPQYAEELGSGTQVPKTFIWSWQGNLIFESGKGIYKDEDHVVAAEKVIKNTSRPIREF